MIKRELKCQFKSFLLWTLVTFSIFLVVFLIYPSIINSENIKNIDDMLKLFPKEILVAFNMDISSLTSAYGWLKSEGFIFILIIVSCYATMLGATIVLKEENEKTIDYLHSLPVSRSNILNSKVITGLFYIIMLDLLIGIFNFGGLIYSGKFDMLQYILLAFTPLFPALVFFFLSLFISTLVHRNKKVTGLCLGIVLISYIIQTLSTLSTEVEVLKYFSLFTLADIRNVISTVSINPIMILISIGLSAIFYLLSLLVYNRKQFF